MAEESTTLIALLHGPDRPGLVARVAGWIYESGGNIRHADQHHDREENVFFQRVEWSYPEPTDLNARAEAFRRLAVEDLGMHLQLARSTDRLRMALFVSKISHCFHDIILRWQEGDLPGDLACVVANHTDLGPEAERYGLPFHHVPVTRETKAEAEARQLAILREQGIELGLLARYMQVLSPDFLKRAGIPFINIHHSFLPAFAGGRPYHQAYARGVKVIGATAHYVTEDLDEGPIIQQETTRVSHRQGVRALVSKGKDLEKSAFAQAVRWHLEHRILVYNNKTVVFD
ncbi:MAG: formyltetrahydrofolate deformylase [Opitutales bacterium]